MRLGLFLELARKPQAVRQVAPELVADLGEPLERLWQLLLPEQGAHAGSALEGHRRARLGASVRGARARPGYDTRDFVAGLRARRDPARRPERHPSPQRRRHSAVDGRTTRHAGYGQSQRRRKLVEQVYGWAKTVARRARASLRARANSRRTFHHPEASPLRRRRWHVICHASRRGAVLEPERAQAVQA